MYNPKRRRIKCFKNITIYEIKTLKRTKCEVPLRRFNDWFIFAFRWIEMPKFSFISEFRISLVLIKFECYVRILYRLVSNLLSSDKPLPRHIIITIMFLSFGFSESIDWRRKCDRIAISHRRNIFENNFVSLRSHSLEDFELNLSPKASIRLQIFFTKSFKWIPLKYSIVHSHSKSRTWFLVEINHEKRI